MGNMWGCAVPPQYSGRILFFLEVPVSGVESDVQPYPLHGRDVTTVLDRCKGISRRMPYPYVRGLPFFVPSASWNGDLRPKNGPQLYMVRVNHFQEELNP
jgi:hypothetical protein